MQLQPTSSKVFGDNAYTLVGESFSRNIVNIVSDRRFSEISRSPHSHSSSKCGFIHEPLSGTYSKLHCSTGTKFSRPSTLFTFSTICLVYDGSPVNGCILTFFFLKLTLGP